MKKFTKIQVCLLSVILMCTVILSPVHGATDLITTLPPITDELTLIKIPSVENKSEITTTEEFPTPTQEQLDRLTDEDWEILNMMTDSGVPFNQAFNILRVDKIVNKLEAYGQCVTSVDNRVIVSPASDGKNYLTTEEETFIIYALTQEIQKYNAAQGEIISRTEAMKILEADMKANPGKEIYSVDMGAGRTLSVRTTLERIPEELDNDSFYQKAIAAGEFDVAGIVVPENVVQEVAEPQYIEVEDQNQRIYITNDGRYYHRYEIVESSFSSYASNWVSVVTEYTNNAYEASMDTLRSGQAAVGVISIANASASIVVPTTSYYENPTVWCEASNAVVFSTSSSITLGELISVSFNINASWTQYAIIRSSIVVIHSYAAIYAIGDFYE